MKMVDAHADYKMNYVIEQLEKLGYHDNDHYTYRELVTKLSAARAMEVDVNNKNEEWF